MDVATQARIAATLKSKGQKMIVTRAGSAVATTHGFEFAISKTNDETSPYAQTVRTGKTLMVAATKTPIAVNDMVAIGKNVFCVLSVEPLAPAGVVLFYKLGVA